MSSSTSARDEIALLKEYLRYRVRQWRESEKREYRELARRACVSPATITSVGGRGGFSEDVMAALIDALGIGSWVRAFREAERWESNRRPG